MGRGSGGGGLEGLRNYASARGWSVRKVPANVHGGRYKFNIRGVGEQRGNMWASGLTDARWLIDQDSRDDRRWKQMTGRS